MFTIYWPEYGHSKILKKSSEVWDVVTQWPIDWSRRCIYLRDPNGIRPAFWYEDDEICVVTSERPVIQTALMFH